MGGGRGGCKREVCVRAREVHRDEEGGIVGVVLSQDSVTTHLLVCVIIECSVSLALQFCLIIVTLGREAGEEEGERDGRRREKREKTEGKGRGKEGGRRGREGRKEGGRGNNREERKEGGKECGFLAPLVEIKTKVWN